MSDIHAFRVAAGLQKPGAARAQLEGQKRVHGDELALRPGSRPGSVRIESTGSSLLGRVASFIRNDGTQHQSSAHRLQANRDIKSALYDAMCKAGSHDMAAKAFDSVGLTPGWDASGKPLSDRELRQILKSFDAQQGSYRNQVDQAVKDLLPKNSSASWAGKEFVIKMIDKEAAAEKTPNDQIRALADRTVSSLVELRDSHPGLALYLSETTRGSSSGPRAAAPGAFCSNIEARFNPASDSSLKGEAPGFQDIAKKSLLSVDGSRRMLPTPLAKNKDIRQSTFDDLKQISDQLEKSTPSSAEGKLLKDGLMADLAHHRHLWRP